MLKCYIVPHIFEHTHHITPHKRAIFCARITLTRHHNITPHSRDAPSPSLMSDPPCLCTNGITVGEFLLSQGLSSVDTKVLAAGEAMHTVCRRERRGDNKREETRVEDRLETVLTERVTHIETLTGQCVEDTRRAANNTEELVASFGGILKQRDSDTAREIARLDEAMRALQTSDSAAREREAVESTARYEAVVAENAGMKHTIIEAHPLTTVLFS